MPSSNASCFQRSDRDIVSTPTPGSLYPETRQTRPWRVLRHILPAAMLIVLLLGIGGGIRLGLALGQPLPGFVMTWRKELKLYTVSYATPPVWPGVALDKLRVKDLILCIDGYHPAPDEAIYGLSPQHDQISCPNGRKKYAELYRERFASGDRYVTFQVDRDGKLLTIPNVPLDKFKLAQLVEIFLPFFLLGLGFLAVGAVVFRAQPGANINLIFAAFTTIVAGVMMDEGSPWRLTDRLENMRWVSIILVIAWLPLLGAVLLHLVSLLSDQHAVTASLRRVRWPAYGLSGLFSLLGGVAFAWDNHPLSVALTSLWGSFVTVSGIGAGIGAIIGLGWTFHKTPSRQTRRQVGLILAGIAILIGFAAPYLFFFYRNGPVSGYMQSLPYLGLAAIGVFAYAILRYQLFAAKSSILTVLLTVVFCIVVANLVHLAFGPTVDFLPILAATLVTSIGLEARQGPTAFFNRLLRRETLDYRAVTHFGQQVGGLQQIESLIQAGWEYLHASLEIDHLEVWLLDEEHQTLDHFTDGQPVGSNAVPPGFAEQLTSHPDPLRAGPTADSAYTRWVKTDDVRLWVPLADRGQAVGLLGLGPRWTGEVYDDPDLQLISILARRLALSILNTRQLERLQTTARLVLQAEENERRKIAHELHDTVLQFMLVLTYGLDDLRERQPALAGEIEHWQDRISAEASQLRSLLSYLRAPELLVQQGLVHSLHAWLGQMHQETSLTIETNLDEEIEPLLTTEAKVAIYRVCREAVHNAVKHAQATRIMLRLGRDGQRVTLVIEDDGQGFAVAEALQPKAKGYNSLQDMRIYMESTGGRLEVRSTPEMGTTIDAWIPIKTNDQTDIKK